MPLFTIVIPCFNAAPTLAETLAGIRAQTFTDWEAIVVDDGSTDDSLAIASAIASRDTRIRLVPNPGTGAASARNHGALTLARGEIIAFCDACDLWSTDKLATLVQVFARPGIDGAFGRVAFLDAPPGEARTTSARPGAELRIPMLLGENPVCTLSNISLRRSVMLASGGFDTDMAHNDDLEWLIRLVGRGARIVGLDQLQVWHRDGDGLPADLEGMAAGRARALASAALFGARPDPAAEAAYQRQLARRALHQGQGRTLPLRLALRGLAHSPGGFLFPLRRGGLTLTAALLNPILPGGLRQRLFAPRFPELPT